MESFGLYLQLGFEHITDVNGYDHILFILALLASFGPRHIKQVILLVTAFTVGHSITLALSTMDIVSIDPDLIESLIPVTILIVCISNLFNLESHNNRPSYVSKKRPFKRYYLEASFFGLIHGLGFSNYLKSLLGSDNQVWEPLLAFNVGLEIGQVIIVLICMFICAVILQFTMWRQRDWNLFLTGGVFVSTLIVMIS